MSIRSKLNALFCLLGALLGSSCVSNAAEIKVIHAGAIDLIYVNGTIEVGDSSKFSAQVPGDRHAVVFLNSPGGIVHEGLNIGLQVRQQGFATAVPADGMCASICSMIWLAGSTRYFEKTSMIGFHAAYSITDGHARVSSSANAEIGYYIGVIGLAPHVARIATEAPPNDMRWMTSTDLLYSGVAVMSVSALGDSKNVKPRPWATDPREMDDGGVYPDRATALMVGKSAVAKFQQVYDDAGISGAQRASESCWREVKSDGSSSLILHCIVFDMLSMIVDGNASKSLGIPPYDYFHSTQLSTRLIAFMKKHQYIPQQVDEMLASASEVVAMLSR